MKDTAQPILALYKTCTSCQCKFEASDDNFHRQAKGRYGFTSKCKKCKNKQIKDWSGRNPDKSRAQKLRWKNKNYDKYLQVKRDDERRRRAGSSGKIDVAEWQAMLDKFGGKCLVCGSSKDITQDHVVPLISGGLNVIENIQPLCRVCNSKKGTKSIDYRPPLRRMMTDTTSIWKDQGGEYRWNRRSENGNIISTSGEGYKNKSHAVRMAKELNPDTIIVDNEDINERLTDME